MSGPSIEATAKDLAYATEEFRYSVLAMLFRQTWTKDEFGALRLRLKALRVWTKKLELEAVRARRDA